MVFTIDKNECDFDQQFCHKIIQYRNKLLVDHNLPKITKNNLFPSSHLPINFINNINDEIFEKINNIIDKIASSYNIKKEYLKINIAFYVENSYNNNEYYTNYTANDYQYGFILPLNESSFYSGGEIYNNDTKINIENNILLFSINDKIKIQNIIIGEQHKLIGYINYELQQSGYNDSLYHFINNKLNIIKNTTHIHYLKNLFSDDKCDFFLNTLSIENIKRINSSIKIDENDNIISYILDDIVFIDFINNLQNDLLHSKIISKILIDYNIRKENLLPFKIKLIKKDINLTYFSPLNSLKDNSLKTENKITLLLTLNSESKICFPNQNIEYNIKKGDIIIVPNSFLFSYYIELDKKNIDYLYLIETSYL